MTVPWSTADRARARWLGVAVAAFALLTFHGFVNLTDGRSMYEVTRSILEDGDLTIIERPLVSVEGQGGEPYSKYGIGLPVLTMPLYAAGWALSLLAGERTFLTQLLVTASMPLVYGLLAAASYLFSRRIGGSLVASVVVAVGGLVGTFLLTYTQEFFSEPVVALLLVVAAERTLAGRPVVAGAALAVAVVTRPQTALVVPVFALGALVRGRVPAVVRMGVPLAGAAAVIVLYNLARFGDPISTGYEGEAFDTPFLEGAWGLLASRDKSVLLFAPVIALAVPAMARLAPTNQVATVLSAGSFLAVFVSTATWHSWEGGYSWGPRLLIPAIPVVLAPVAPWLDNRPGAHRMAAGLLAVGLVVSLATVIVPSTAQLVYQGQLGEHGPSVAGQYELVDDVVRNTAEGDCDAAPAPVQGDRHCMVALWQVEVARRFGVAGWAGAVVGSVGLAAIGVAATRRLNRELRSPVRQVVPSSGG